MTSDPGARYHVRENLLLTGSEGAKYLTDVETGEVYELNETAIVIFQAVRDGLSSSEVVDRMAKEYPDVPLEELRRDVQDTLLQLADSGLLERRA